MQERAQRSFWFLFGAIWLSVGVLFLAVAAAVAYSQNRARSELAASGEDVSGTVLVKTRDAESATGRFHVRYRYHSRDGRKHYGGSSVDGPVWDRLTELGPLKVRYLPADPDHSTLEGAEPSRFLGAIFGALGLILTVVGSIVLRHGRKERLKGARR